MSSYSPPHPLQVLLDAHSSNVWIPTSVRMPPDDNFVDVVWAGCVPHYALQYQDGQWLDPSGRVWEGITHWKPRPTFGQ